MTKKDDLMNDINEVNACLVGLMAKIAFYQKKLQALILDYNNTVAEEIENGQTLQKAE